MSRSGGGGMQERAALKQEGEQEQEEEEDALTLTQGIGHALTRGSRRCCVMSRGSALFCSML